MTLDPQTAGEIPLEPLVGSPHPDVHVAYRRRGMFFLGLAVGAVGLAMAMQGGVNANYVADVMGLTGQQQGTLEAWRESCGITALVVLAMLAGLAEPLVGAGLLALMGVGLAGYAYVPDFFWLVAASLVWSQGLHVWMPLPESMTLAMAEPGRQGHRLGQMRAAGAVGSAAGLVGAYVLYVWLGWRIRPMFLIAGGVVILAAASCLAIPRKIRTPGPRFVLRRKYWLYYLLSFLEGWRKQIFIAFAGFLLVKKYGTPLETMLLLWMIVQVIGYVGSPFVGRLIDRVGERLVLVFYFSCLAPLFVGYGTIENKHVLYVLFIIDSAMFTFVMALTMYANRMVPPSERTPTLSMGVAFNHVAAVVMPLLGGLIWRYAGFRWVFYLGAAAAVASVVPALMVPAREKVAGSR